MATHHRNPASSRKNQSTQNRPQRPGLGGKRQSSHHALSKANGKNVQIKEEEPEDEAMAASFLQFCTTCEKQIIVPSNSILYCSEGCRRKDNAKVLSYQHGADSPPMTPLQQFAFDDFPIRNDIVPQRSPTAVNTASNRLSYSSFSEDEGHYSDSSDQKPDVLRRYSEATRYLRQIQTPEDNNGTSSTPRPKYNRSYTALSTLSNAPSLSHSPTSTTGMSFPYTPSSTQRPLPPRTNPFSTSYKDSRSIDLVNPFALTQRNSGYTTAPSSLHHQPYSSQTQQYPHTYQSRHDSHQYDPSSSRRSSKADPTAQISTGFAEGEMLVYEKNAVVGSPLSAGHGSLKQLFRFSEMQAPPSQGGGQLNGGYARY